MLKVLSFVLFCFSFLYNCNLKSTETHTCSLPEFCVTFYCQTNERKERWCVNPEVSGSSPAPVKVFFAIFRNFLLSCTCNAEERNFGLTGIGGGVAPLGTSPKLEEV